MAGGWASCTGAGRDFSKALLINARGEELAKKKTFQPALNGRRCLIPASGFYEWREADRQPFYFRRTDGDASPSAAYGIRRKNWLHSSS